MFQFYSTSLNSRVDKSNIFHVLHAVAILSYRPSRLLVVCALRCFAAGASTTSVSSADSFCSSTFRLFDNDQSLYGREKTIYWLLLKPKTYSLSHLLPLSKGALLMELYSSHTHPLISDRAQLLSCRVDFFTCQREASSHGRSQGCSNDFDAWNLFSSCQKCETHRQGRCHIRPHGISLACFLVRLLKRSKGRRSVFKEGRTVSAEGSARGDAESRSGHFCSMREFIMWIRLAEACCPPGGSRRRWNV